MILILGTVWQGGLRALAEGRADKFEEVLASSHDSARCEWWRGAGLAAKGTEAIGTLAISAKPADGPGVLEIFGVFGRILVLMGGLGGDSGRRRVDLQGKGRGGAGWKA